jgi:protein-S-isoprenylcysteine O-methyltransferase Ste14
MRLLIAISWKLLLVIVIWLAMGWLVGQLRPLDASLGTELPAWFQLPGIVALLAGAAGVLVCGAMLSTRGIGTLRGKEWNLPVTLLVTGPFRFVRNPMSLAGFTLMVGIALWYRSTMALGFAALLFVLLHLVAVYVEEPGLERRFGDSYREYKRHVPRWLPRWPAWSGSNAEHGGAGR